TYIDFLLEYCLSNSIDAIISLFDVDLPVLAKHKYIFEQKQITLVVSDLQIINLCNDKWMTFSFLSENNFNTPNTFLDIEKCKEAIRSKIISFPIIIKPRWGMGSVGIFEAE